MSVPKTIRPCGAITAALSGDIIIKTDKLEGINGKQ